MNELVTAVLDEGNVTILADFPTYLMNNFEQELVSWTLSYVKKFRTPPSVERLRREFSGFIPLRADPPLPVKDIFELTLKRKRRDFALSRISELEATIKDTDDVPLEKFTELMTKLSLSDTTLAKYSTYDRSLYFRTDGLKFGLPLIDRVTGGLSNGDFGVLAGRLGTGKSTISQHFMHKWWNEGRRILCISKEMLAPDVFTRLDGMVGRFNPLSLRTSPREEVMPMLQVVSGIASSHKGEIIIPSRAIHTPAQVATLARYLDIDLIVVDGVYLMKPDENYAQKWERVAAVSNALKQTALDLQIPILGTTQIKRVGAKDEFDPEDLAYSDALGQDADFVMAINPSKAIKNRIEVQLIKNRYGPEMATVVFMDFETMGMTDESVEGRVEDDDD